MKTTLIASALVAAIAAPAFAAGTQLERQLGVEPGVYSFTELAAIKGSYDTDTGYVFPVENGNVVSTQSVGISPAHAQLAANLGLDANEYSFAELAGIKASYDSEDGYTVPAKGGIVSTQNVGSTAARDQLAGTLDIDATGLSFADVAAIFGARNSAND